MEIIDPIIFVVFSDNRQTIGWILTDHYFVFKGATQTRQEDKALFERSTVEPRQASFVSKTPFSKFTRKTDKKGKMWNFAEPLAYKDQNKFDDHRFAPGWNGKLSAKEITQDMIFVFYNSRVQVVSIVTKDKVYNRIKDEVESVEFDTVSAKRTSLNQREQLHFVVKKDEQWDAIYEMVLRKKLTVNG